MRVKKRSFFKRMTGVDFLLKLVALLVLIFIMHYWTSEDISYDRLPCKSYFEWDLYFHAVFGYIFVLGGQLLLYFIGEIPSLLVQRVVLLYGAGLFIACAVVGLMNYFWLEEGFREKMLIIALLCFLPALCMCVDHLWQEEWLKSDPEEEDEEQQEEEQEKEGGSTKTPSKTTTPSPSIVSASRPPSVQL